MGCTLPNDLQKSRKLNKWRFNNDRFLNRGRKVNIEGKDKKESTQFPCGFADYGFAAIISKWLANFD